MRRVEYDHQEIPISMDKVSIPSMDVIDPWVQCNMYTYPTLHTQNYETRNTIHASRVKLIIMLPFIADQLLFFFFFFLSFFYLF